MLNNAANNPTALVEFDTTINRWVQIRETANRAPTEATRIACAQYLPTIEGWKRGRPQQVCCRCMDLELPWNRDGSPRSLGYSKTDGRISPN